MDFWEHVYNLRRTGLIARDWKRADLRPHLEKPAGPFSQTTITTVPSNRSLKLDCSELGNDVMRGRSPKAWRVERGVFRLIVDPDDDKKTQDAEFARALHVAKLGRPPAKSDGSPMPARRSVWYQNIWNDLFGPFGYRTWLLVFTTVVGAYFGLYAVMVARHDRLINRALFERNAFVTMVASGNRTSFVTAMKDFGPVQTVPAFVPHRRWNHCVG